jgi:predicted dienelactone hydrolase
MPSLRILLASLALILLANAPTVAAPPQDFASPGPDSVGFKQMSLPDKDGKRPLALTIWYPAVTDPSQPSATFDAKPGNPSAVRAMKDAPPAATGGPYPLVIIAHGLMGSGSVYFLWGTHLASYGFVVMTVDAKDFGDSSLDAASNAEADAIVLLHDHPADVMREIAFADMLTAPGGPFASLIDTAHIGVWGYAAGATTALQAAGARIDFQALAGWCTDKRSDYFAEESCQFVGHEMAVAALFGVADPMAGALPPIWDKRVGAIVLAGAGGHLHVFDGDGLTGLAVPTLLMAGTGDVSVSPAYNSLWAYDQIGSPIKALAVFDGGTGRMFRSCCGYDRAQGGPNLRDLKAHLTTAFLLSVLKGDPAAHQALLPGAFNVTGVEYNTTMR